MILSTCELRLSTLEEEQDRLGKYIGSACFDREQCPNVCSDLMHALSIKLLDNRLYRAPFGDVSPQHVLDIGTGMA